MQEITSIETIKQMLFNWVFDLDYLDSVKSVKYDHRGVWSEKTEDGVIEYYPDDSTQFFSNEEIYSSFLKSKGRIPKDVLRAWGYQ